MTTKYTFPPNFTWGAATSAYQIEGAWDADGKGESIWDRFSHAPGNVRNGDTGDVACDHYHRWREDIELMKAIGLNAYRFSISWARLLPEGTGRVNKAGMDFYDSLVDGLLEASITPFVTLYHWDLPQALQERGGWAAREITEAFCEYADLVSRQLGDRVKYWMTHNEPSVVVIPGYVDGVMAPGINDLPTAMRASHHLLLSHGMAVPVIRLNSPGAQVGPAININWTEPASASPADYHADRISHGMWVRWYLDPLYGRGYPQDMTAHFEAQGGFPDGIESLIHASDMETIATTTDFLGLNYYTRFLARDTNLPEEQRAPQTVFQASKDHGNWTDMDWEVYPHGLFRVLANLYYEYKIPAIYITENGASYYDPPEQNGEINDERRVRYLYEHLRAAHLAIENGVPLRGYFVWSLLDNFEWALGYSQHFGMIACDIETGTRTMRKSAYWYRDTIARNGFD